MRCEVLAIGTELLLGQIVDTNSAYIGEQLAAIGIDSYEHRVLGDNQTRIVAGIRDLLSRSDAVLICGGTITLVALNSSVGAAFTTAADGVVFDYEGKLVTGETFDSSYARGEPISGGVGDFVPGFTEALMLMRPGDEWVVWIPPALGYGDRESESIPANSVLRFRMELRQVIPAAPAG